MSGINPIPGSLPPVPAASPANATGLKSSAPKSGFGEMLKQCMDRVQADQQTASTAVEDLLSGKSQDILPVVAEVAKADMSFKLLIGVRNKMIEAYKQTMNMQI